MEHAETLVAGQRPWHRGESARLGAVAVTLALTLAAALTGATLDLTAESAPASETPESGGSSSGTAPALPASAPAAVRIPAIDLEADRIVGLGRTPSGALEVPAAAATVGWLRTGVTPGEAGAAVLVGHQQLGYARGAFQEVPELRPGDTITVARENGTSGTFAVYRVTHTTGVASAAELATSATGKPELRLITWDEHSPAAHTQARSVVVLAALTTAQEPVTTGR